MSPPRTFLDCRIHFLPGMAHGTGQSTLLANFEIEPSRVVRLEAFDDYLNRHVEERLPTQGDPSGTPARIAWRLLHAHGAIQRQQKIPVFGAGRHIATKVREGRSTLIVLAFPAHELAPSRIAIDWLVRTMETLAGPDPAAASLVRELDQAFEACTEQLRAHALGGINSYHFLRTAFALGIPATRWLPDVYCFGQGAHSRLIQRSLTESTPALGTATARRKSFTAHVLRRHGVPVPAHMRVATEAEAVSAADSLGYPVVVKPDDQEQGRGVAAGLRDAASVADAFRAAAGLSTHVLVEKHHEGEDYRLTVFQGQVVKILHRQACRVVGDGARSVRELVAIEQQTPRFQGVLLREGKMLIELDEEALGLLKDQGLSPQSVPAAGRAVQLRRKANISAGGVQTLVPVDQCHPDNAALVVRACAALRLDLCGVDLIIADISRSWLETGAVILELNAQPQIGWHQGPEAYARVLTGLLQGRWAIPLRLVVRAAGPAPATLAAVKNLFPGFDANAWSAGSSVWIDDQLVTTEPADGFHAAQVALADTRVRAAGFVMTLDELARTGLPAPSFECIALQPPRELSAEEQMRWAWAESLVEGNAQRIERSGEPQVQSA